MTIPEVRARLLALADEIEAERMFRSPVSTELRALAAELARRPARPKAPPASTPMTPELREVIRVYALEHPEMTELQVGVIFGVNQGRVSEALRGFRD